MLAETPLVTADEKEDEVINYGAVLTADFGGGVEGRGHLRIHGDHDVLLLGDRLIPGFNLVLHPAAEHAAEHGGADVADPLLADLVDFLRVRHVVKDLLMAVVEEEVDVLER